MPIAFKSGTSAEIIDTLKEEMKLSRSRDDVVRLLELIVSIEKGQKALQRSILKSARKTMHEQKSVS